MAPKMFYLLSIVLLLGLSGAGNSIAAQTGTLTGTVVDVETGSPVGNAEVELLGATGAAESRAVSAADGRFRLTAPGGSYSIVVTRLGFEATRRDGVSIDAGDTRDVTIEITSRALALNPIVVTASRREEKALEAPASVSIVSADRIRQRVALSPIDHVRTLPGVDAVQTGLQQSNMVARGFNNVFSGALLVLTDNRYASVPSLRVNAYNFIPTTSLDIDRIEVVLGPGAALYGPNSASGVMHLITSSPLDDAGTRLSLAGGERGVVQGMGRHSLTLNDRLGFKISGQYFRGEDWIHRDSAEVRAAREDGASPLIGARDFDSERWGGEARMDYRFGDDAELILSAGVNNSNSIELTGLGAGQAVDWRYNYYQARIRSGRLFSQVFMNTSDAGDTYLLRTGQPIVDKSVMYVGQVQHGFGWGERQDFTYGIDLQRTLPRTEGTITGRNEDDDDIDEAGAYLHSETRLTDRLDFVGAVRLDHHNRLEDPVFSPRAALVFRPAEDQNFRATFSRGFSTPTTNNLFLDIRGGGFDLAPLPISYDIRVRGVPESGFTFDDRCTGGVQELCMRSPFAGGAQVPAHGAAVWNAFLAGMDPALQAALADPGQPGDPELASHFLRLDAETGEFVPLPGGPEPIDRIRPTITNTYELGYKGLIGDRLLLSADVYRSDVKDFVGPLRVETPMVFLDGQSVAQYIGYRAAVNGIPLSEDDIAQMATQIAMIPTGTVVPDQNDNTDLVMTYRNFGDVDFWGSDLGAQFLATDQLSFTGSYSWVSDDCFALGGGTADCDDPSDVALNAPQHKGSLGVRFESLRHGYSLEGRGRFTAGFPMNSGVYVGRVDGYQVFDANVGYRLPMVPNATLTLTATNIFDDRRQEFVGAPEIGRLALLRLMYEF